MPISSHHGHWTPLRRVWLHLLYAPILGVYKHWWGVCPPCGQKCLPSSEIRRMEWGILTSVEWFHVSQNEDLDNFSHVWITSDSWRWCSFSVTLKGKGGSKDESRPSSSVWVAAFIPFLGQVRSFKKPSENLQTRKSQEKTIRCCC